MLQQIILKFHDVEDVINHRRRIRIFLSPVFEKYDGDSKVAAMEELFQMYRKEGFDVEDVISSRQTNYQPVTL